MYKARARSSSGRVAGSIVLALAAMAPFLSAYAQGQSVTLEWDSDADPDVVGYNLYYGGASQTYTNMVSVGDATATTISGLLAGAEYFFAATAVDAGGRESDFSNEISYQVPGAGELVVTAANQSWTYGAANPTLTGTVSGLQNGDNITATFSTVATPASPVGTYSIAPTLIDPGGKLTNYTVTINDGTLTVNPAALTITADNASTPYGTALPALTASYSGFVNGDTASNLTTPPTLGTTATAASPAGSYPITASGAASPNYTINYASGTLTVNPAVLIITADNASTLYGATMPGLTASYSGFVNGDTASNLTVPPTLGTTATAASPVGSYPITASGAASPNYTINYASGTLTVNPAVLIITADNASTLYGATMPALTASYSGFVNGDTASNLTTPPTLGTTATVASPVGSYPITASGAASPNYTINYASGTLTVSPAALTITAANVIRLYGAVVPALTASYSGFVNGDTPSSLTAPPFLTTTATAASPVGSYPITVSSAASPNYTIGYASGTLTVGPAGLTITAADASKLYGAPLATLTASYSGFVNGDTASTLTTPPTLTTTATVASPVGTYSIIASGAGSPNYTINYASGTLTVGPAGLTITAADGSKLYGAAVPALTASYSGFANGDTPSSLTAPPFLTTAATAASPVGSYPITVSSATSPNYSINFVSGTLTILPAAAAALVTSSANPSLPGAQVTFSMVLSAVAPGAGVPTGTVQFIIDGAVAGSPAPLSGGTASYTTSALGHGTHTVAAQYAGDGNFSGTTNFLAGTQVVDTPPVPGAIAITYDSAIGAQMSLAALLGQASDADGDPITLASMATASANGGSVSSSGGWVFYVPAPGFTNADTFTYAISDGYCSPVTGTVTLSLRCDNSSSANLTVSALGNGSYAISGNGVPGRLYALQFADGGQTMSWQALGQAVADPNGLFGFIDPNGSPQRLYRTVCP
jgi:hypothetical protein